MLSEKHQLQIPSCTDFRPYWAEVFQFKWHRLHKLVGFYLSLDCGSCQLERDLGRLAGISDTRCGAAQSDCADLERCLEIMLDGPQCETDLFERHVPNTPFARLTEGISIATSLPATKPELRMTAQSREMCTLWVEYFGRRFCVYRRRADSGISQGHRLGSEAFAISGQKQGRDLLVAGNSADLKLLGKERRKFAKPVGQLERHRLFNDSMQKFRARSKEIKAGNLKLRQRTWTRENLHPPGQIKTPFAFRFTYFKSCKSPKSHNMSYCQAQNEKDKSSKLKMIRPQCQCSQDGLWPWIFAVQPLLCTSVAKW